LVHAPDWDENHLDDQWQSSRGRRRRRRTWTALLDQPIGNVAWFTIVDRLPTSVSTLSPILVPVVAMISGAIVRHEPLGPLECLAMACSALGLFLGLRHRD